MGGEGRRTELRAVRPRDGGTRVCKQAGELHKAACRRNKGGGLMQG